jgi:hypothetical protein
MFDVLVENKVFEGRLWCVHYSGVHDINSTTYDLIGKQPSTLDPRVRNIVFAWCYNTSDPFLPLLKAETIKMLIVTGRRTLRYSKCVAQRESLGSYFFEVRF